MHYAAVFEQAGARMQRDSAALVKTNVNQRGCCYFSIVSVKVRFQHTKKQNKNKNTATPPYKYGGVASLNKVSSLFNGSFPSHCYQLIAHRGVI